MNSRSPCKICGAMALAQTIDVTVGLCMPCHKKNLSEVQNQKNAAERAMMEKNAILLPDSLEEEAFLQRCAVQCDLDCCGFDAIEISEDQFQRTVAEVGLDCAAKALSAMTSQIDRIGDHPGFVRFRGYYEPASTIKRNYEHICSILERIIQEAEKAGTSNGR